jgi:hypothetical protein
LGIALVLNGTAAAMGSLFSPCFVALVNQTLPFA